jgi:hypothetical protein
MVQSLHITITDVCIWCLTKWPTCSPNSIMYLIYIDTYENISSVTNLDGSLFLGPSECLRYWVDRPIWWHQCHWLTWWYWVFGCLLPSAHTITSGTGLYWPIWFHWACSYMGPYVYISTVDQDDGIRHSFPSAHMIISGIQVHRPTCLHQYHGLRWWHRVFIILGPSECLRYWFWSAHMIVSVPSAEMIWPICLHQVDSQGRVNATQYLMLSYELKGMNAQSHHVSQWHWYHHMGRE